MYPWNRILIPTDCSTASHWSFDTAVDMAGTTVFDERNLQVTDQTREMTEQLKARSRQLSGLKRPDQRAQPPAPVSR